MRSATCTLVSSAITVISPFKAYATKYVGLAVLHLNDQLTYLLSCLPFSQCSNCADFDLCHKCMTETDAKDKHSVYHHFHKMMPPAIKRHVSDAETNGTEAHQPPAQ